MRIFAGMYTKLLSFLLLLGISTNAQTPWNLSGNSVSDNNSFLGTTNNYNVNIGVNSVPMIQLTNDSAIYIQNNKYFNITQVDPISGRWGHLLLSGDSFVASVNYPDGSSNALGVDGIVTYNNAFSANEYIGMIADNSSVRNLFYNLNTYKARGTQVDKYGIHFINYDFSDTLNSNFINIDSLGNMGIGLSVLTDLPTAKLDLKGTFRLRDGTQGANKVLTSDNQGNASWQNMSTAVGVWMCTNPTYTSDSTFAFFDPPSEIMFIRYGADFLMPFDTIYGGWKYTPDGVVHFRDKHDVPFTLCNEVQVQFFYKP